MGLLISVSLKTTFQTVLRYLRYIPYVLVIPGVHSPRFLLFGQFAGFFSWREKINQLLMRRLFSPLSQGSRVSRKIENRSRWP